MATIRYQHTGSSTPASPIVSGVAPLSVGSVFAGIGGIDLGLERAGMKIAFQVERDEFCRRVLARHWPEVPRYTDAGLYSRRAIESQAFPPVDVLAGGVPCQPWSVAGKRRGQADDRDLWPAFRRLVGVLRPRVVLVEEVPGFALGAGLGRALRDLAALGYDAEWDIVSAQDVGAPHLRKRLFIVAYDSRRRRESQREREHGEFRSRDQADGVADGDGERFAERAESDERQVEPEQQAPRRGDAVRCDSDVADACQERHGGLTEAAGRDNLDRASTGREEGAGRAPERSEVVAHRQSNGRDEGRAEPAGQQGRPDVAERSDSALADSDSSRPQERKDIGGDEREERAASVGGRGQLDDTDRRRHVAPQGTLAETIRDDLRVFGERIGGEHRIEGATLSRDDSSERRGDAKSELGVRADGVPDRVDGARWPAPPGKRQHDWEPPRICESYRGRSDELKALGNAVVPQVAEWVGRRIVEALEEENRNERISQARERRRLGR